MNYFSLDNIAIHNSSNQLEQQTALSYLKIKKLEDCYIVTEELPDELSHEYHASLDHCNCDYFTEYHLPCRHMYRVATKEKVFKVIRPKRSEKLMADFSDGYAAGWKFIVRKCNWPYLDILYTPRKKNKKLTMVLTQGSCFSFASGLVFYDTIDAYSMTWGNALKSIHVSLQIKSSTPTVAVYQVFAKNGILVNQSHYVYGTVEFALYRPNADHTQEKEISRFTCQQDEFVRLLKTGIFTDTDNVEHNLFKE